MAIPKFMPTRLAKIGATITKLADDAIDFVTKEGKQISLRYSKDGKIVTRGSGRNPNGAQFWSLKHEMLGSQPIRQPVGYKTSLWHIKDHSVVATDITHTFSEGTKNVKSFEIERLLGIGDTYQITGHLRETSDGSVKLAYTKIHDSSIENVSMGQGMKILDKLPFVNGYNFKRPV